MKLLIQNGRVIDPATGFDHTADIAVRMAVMSIIAGNEA